MKKFNVVKKDFVLCGKHFMKNAVYGEFLRDNKRYIYYLDDFTPKSIETHDRIIMDCAYNICVLEFPLNVEVATANELGKDNVWKHTTTANKKFRALYPFLNKLILRNNWEHVKPVNNLINWKSMQANKTGALRVNKTAPTNTEKRRYNNNSVTI